MTVAELLAELARYPRDLEVTSIWDTVPTMPVHGVHLFQDRVVIDCGSGDDGDWETVLEEEQVEIARADAERSKRRRP